MAEVIAGPNSGCLQIGLLTPDAICPRKNIDRAAVTGAIVGLIASHVAIFKRSPDDQCVPIKRDARAIVITGLNSGSLQISQLAPDTCTLREHIDCTTTAGGIVGLIAGHTAVFKRSPDDQCVPIKRDAMAEVIAGPNSGCLQIGLLTPDAICPRKNIDRAAVTGGIVGLIAGHTAVFKRSPDDQCVPIKRDARAEVITGPNSGSLQISLLTPDTRTLREHIDCTTTAGGIVGLIAGHTAVFKRSPDDQCVPIEGHRRAKKVTRTWI